MVSNASSISVCDLIVSLCSVWSYFIMACTSSQLLHEYLSLCLLHSVALGMLKAYLMERHQTAPSWLMGIGWAQREAAEMLEKQALRTIVVTQCWCRQLLSTAPKRDGLFVSDKSLTQFMQQRQRASKRQKLVSLIKTISQDHVLSVRSPPFTYCSSIWNRTFFFYIIICTLNWPWSSMAE